MRDDPNDEIRFKGLDEIGDIRPLWRKPADGDLPETGAMGQSVLCWICYYRRWFGLAMNIAIYISGLGGGWFEMHTMNSVSNVIAWTPVILPPGYDPPEDELQQIIEKERSKNDE